MSRFDQFSAGLVVQATTAGVTIHTEPAAIPGSRRGSLLRCTISNPGAGTVACTVAVGAGTGTVDILASSQAHLEVWVPGGSSFVVTTDTGTVDVYGHIEPKP